MGSDEQLGALDPPLIPDKPWLTDPILYQRAFFLHTVRDAEVQEALRRRRRRLLFGSDGCRLSRARVGRVRRVRQQQRQRVLIADFVLLLPVGARAAADRGDAPETGDAPKHGDETGDATVPGDEAGDAPDPGDDGWDVPEHGDEGWEHAHPARHEQLQRLLLKR